MPAYKKVSKGIKRQPTTPVKGKAPVRRRASDVSSSSSLDLSDEDGYSDLDDLTSDEDDEEDVEAAEEEHIIQSSPQPTEEDEEGDDEAGDAEDEEEEDDDDDDDEEEDNDPVESASWDGILSDVDVDELNQDETDTLSLGNDSAVERRVRFDVPDSSDGDSTETDEDVVNRDFFPDIFVPQSSLDPGFRREIERDHDDDNNSDSGFWDFHSHDFSNHHDSPFDDNVSTDIEAVLQSLQEDDDSTPVATPMNRHESSTAQSSLMPSPEMDDDTSLDGYQTDGDTTEEEDDMDARPVRPKTARELAEEDSDSEVVTIIRARRGQPRVGRFTLDNPRKKPIAIVNPKTGKMMIFTPQGGRNGGLDLSPEQFNFQWFEAEPQSSPMVNSGNMMMSAMVSSNTFGDFMNTQAIGPEEAFFSLPPDTNYLDDSGGEHDQEDEEKHLQLEDFIDFDDEFEGLSGDEGAGDNEDPILCTPNSMGRPATGSSDMTSLLDHFEANADLVGAFRRDQANHQLISRSKATRESLAFSGPYYEGTLRGIKDGRIASTNVPISPLRKQRRTSELASSPLNTVNQKRKASSQQDWGHKRQRSMPDVNVLTL
ncbi:uncharacterized protein B0I36DRAFT_343515 [Microdochium trichocladiopsis]|uniref:Uncharacterized protein n=1 Tax=Microdochium trichocladiopsis TaxID=1682393 RepID=A0A9P8YIJ6_9PEZI|nr:uncharacterized protein B0I36DRAFT_343515 [Microdochium trichocladiopsis]KAH7039654.1 hypothetical protein B0I36DRAFT_343515 [Microdochium trichocladiopsis]